MDPWIHGSAAGAAARATASAAVGAAASAATATTGCVTVSLSGGAVSLGTFLFIIQNMFHNKKYVSMDPWICCWSCC